MAPLFISFKSQVPGPARTRRSIVESLHTIRSLSKKMVSTEVADLGWLALALTKIQSNRELIFIFDWWRKHAVPTFRLKRCQEVVWHQQSHELCQVGAYMPWYIEKPIPSFVNQEVWYCQRDLNYQIVAVYMKFLALRLCCRYGTRDGDTVGELRVLEDVEELHQAVLKPLRVLSAVSLVFIFDWCYLNRRRDFVYWLHFDSRILNRFNRFQISLLLTLLHDDFLAPHWSVLINLHRGGEVEACFFFLRCDRRKVGLGEKRFSGV